MIVVLELGLVLGEFLGQFRCLSGRKSQIFLSSLNFASQRSDLVVLSFNNTVESFKFLGQQSNLVFVLSDFLVGITAELLILSLDFFQLIAGDLQLIVELSDLGS